MKSALARLIRATMLVSVIFLLLYFKERNNSTVYITITYCIEPGLSVAHVAY